MQVAYIPVARPKSRRPGEGDKRGEGSRVAAVPPSAARDEASPSPASEGDTRRGGWILVLIGVLLVLIAVALILVF